MKISNTLKVILRILAGILFFSMLLLIIWLFEHKQEDASIKSLFDVFWFSIVTLTTVGYGDYYPVTIVGRITGLILVLFSFGLLGYIIGNLTNKIREYMEKKKYGQFGTNMENHVVIIGWNNFGKLIADQVIKANQSIAVITDVKDSVDLINTNYGDKVFTLFSDLDAFEDFKKVKIESTCSVFINIPDDSKALVYLLNIKKVYKNINAVVSLSNSELKDTFYSAGANYVISEKELSSRLIASYIFEPDVAHYTEDLITTSSAKDATDILEVKVTDSNPYLNKDYIDAFVDLKKTYNSVLIGISRKENGNYNLIKNPNGGEDIKLDDYLIVISDGLSKNKLTSDFQVSEGESALKNPSTMIKMIQLGKYKLKWIHIFFVFILFYSCELEDFGVDSDDPRDDIVDVWSCEEESDTGTTNYTSEISIHPSDSSKIIINYIYGLGRDAEAIATYKNRTITIPQQNIEDIIIKGTGNVSSDYSEIRFNYTADDGSGDIDNVFALYTR